MSAKPPKIRYSHDGVIDLIIAEPMISQNEIAARFGYTPSWISTIMTSDAFKARLELRKEELVDPVLRMSLEERFRAVTTRSLEVLMEKLAQPTTQIPDSLALRAMELGAKSLGLGASQVALNVTFPSTSEVLGDIQRGAQRVVDLRESAGDTIDMNCERLSA